MGAKLVRPLIEVLACIPDPRGARGKRHPLTAILALACAAMLCGSRSLYAIAQWGRDHGVEMARALGFTRPKTPSVSTLHRLFTKLDVQAFEQALAEWAESVLQASGRRDGLQGIAIDGKELRGVQGHAVAGVHLLAAVSHGVGLVQKQVRVGEQTNEISAVSSLLDGLILTGRVVTMDAILTQRKIAETILEGGGDYLQVVKENQPTLVEDIAPLFAESSPPSAGADKRGSNDHTTRRSY